MSRFKATYKGAIIGWYDTADEAHAALDEAREQERTEIQEWEQKQRDLIGT